MKKIIIKSINPPKNDIMFEIHKFGCPDNYRNDPIQVFVTEGENAEEVIKKDIGSEYDFESHRKEYRIMPCCK